MYDSRLHIEAHLRDVRNRDWNRPITAFDLETDGLHGPITLGAYAIQDGAVVFTDPEKVVPTLRPPIVGHNLKYDLLQLVRAGVEFPMGLTLDTLPAAHLLHEEDRNGLKDLVPRYLGVKDEEWESGWAPTMEPEALRDYAMKDVVYTRQLALRLWADVRDQGLLMQWLKIEVPLVFLTVEMENHGIRIDRDLLELRVSQSASMIEQLRNIVRASVPGYPWDCERCEGTGMYRWKRGSKMSVCLACEGTGANDSVWNSPSQRADLLYRHLGLKAPYLTDTGQPSTNEASLLKLRDRAPIDEACVVHRLMELQSFTKLHNAFYVPYLELGSDRIHATFNPWGTKTGRWSSSKPNLQQVPSAARALFIPDEGMKFINIDYTQLELYLMAEFSGEEKILEVYSNGGDLHQRTADVAGCDRFGGKTINFALAYGLSTGSLADRLNIGRDEAEKIRGGVMGGYSSLFNYFSQLKEEAREKGYVETLFRRKRRVKNLDSRDHLERFKAENQVVNSVIQGSAADLTKAAMLKCKLNVPEAQQLAQVHDSVLFQVPTEHAPEIAAELLHQFETAVPNLTPKAKVTILDRWE